MDKKYYPHGNGLKVVVTIVTNKGVSIVPMLKAQAKRNLEGGIIEIMDLDEESSSKILYKGGMDSRMAIESIQKKNSLIKVDDAHIRGTDIVKFEMEGGYATLVSKGKNGDHTVVFPCTRKSARALRNAIVQGRVVAIDSNEELAKILKGGIE